MTKETINGKEYEIKKMKYLDAVDLEELSKKEKAIKLMTSCTNLTELEIGDLSLSDGIRLQRAINKINGLDEDENFTNPIENKED